MLAELGLNTITAQPHSLQIKIVARQVKTYLQNYRQRVYKWNKPYRRPRRCNRDAEFGNWGEFVRLAIVERLERDQVIIDAMQA